MWEGRDLPEGRRPEGRGGGWEVGGGGCGCWECEGGECGEECPEEEECWDEGGEREGCLGLMEDLRVRLRGDCLSGSLKGEGSNDITMM